MEVCRNILDTFSTSKPVYFAVNPSVLPSYVREEFVLASHLMGGVFNREFNEIEPSNHSLLNKQFSCTTNKITQELGKIGPTKWTSINPVNSAKNAEQLHSDAELAAPLFKKGCQQIAESCEGQANFGPGNAFAVKKLDSLNRKILSDSKQENISIEQATQKIGDALRGTVIVNSLDQMKNATQEINQWIQKQNGEIVWKNFFQNNQESGYVGLHAKLALPFTNDQGEKSTILCELQLHLNSINDGTEHSPKERMHLLYEKTRSALPDEQLTAINSISQLSFLSGMPSMPDCFV